MRYDSARIFKDLANAVMGYERAAEVGYKLAVYELYKCYRDGNSVDKDIDNAIKCYGKSAKQGNIKAQNEVGRILQQHRE